MRSPSKLTLRLRQQVQCLPRSVTTSLVPNVSARSTDSPSSRFQSGYTASLFRTEVAAGSQNSDRSDPSCRASNCNFTMIRWTGSEVRPNFTLSGASSINLSTVTALTELTDILAAERDNPPETYCREHNTVQTQNCV